MTTNGLKDHELVPTMFVDTEPGVGHKFADGSVMKADGSTYKPGSTRSFWDGGNGVVLYNDQLNPLPGKHTYYVRLFLWDKTTKAWVPNCISEFVKYDITGATPKAQNNKNNNAPTHQNNNNPNFIVRTYREEIPYGSGFHIINEYADGSKQKTSYTRCTECKGLKRCNDCFCQMDGRCGQCNGRGEVRGWDGLPALCMSCGGGGKCRKCKGTGRCYLCKESEYPGYIVLGFAHFEANGQYHGYSPWESTRARETKQRESKKTCESCGGTRIYQQGKYPEWVRPNTLPGIYKYHDGKSRCNLCGEWQEHWHSFCPYCR